MLWCLYSHLRSEDGLTKSHRKRQHVNRPVSVAEHSKSQRQCREQAIETTVMPAERSTQTREAVIGNHSATKAGSESGGHGGLSE